MYGYVFGAAKLGLWHTWDETSMIYPGYAPTGAGGCGAWGAASAQDRPAASTTCRACASSGAIVAALPRLP